MIPQFAHLNADVKNQLYCAPLWVTLLIAGADDKIDEAEYLDGVKLTHYRTITAPAPLQGYYKVVDETFEQDLDTLLAKLPDNRAERQPLVMAALEEINALLPQLDAEFAAGLVKSLQSFAAHIARASGGFLGFLAESPEEKALLDLPMLQAPSTD